MIKVVIFDFDGVLIDSETKSVIDNINFLKINGVKKPNEKEIKELVGATDIDNYLYMAKALDISFLKAKKMLTLYIEENPYDASLLFPEVHMLLNNLYGNVKMSIASNSPQAFLDRITEEACIGRYFEKIVSCREIGTKKPEPDIYIYTSKLLDVNPDECLVVEDSPLGILAAKRAGMKVIGIHNDYLKLNIDSADYKINNLLEITKILEMENSK